MNQLHESQYIDAAIRCVVPNSVTKYLKNANVTLTVLMDKSSINFARYMLDIIGYRKYTIRKSNFTSIVFIIVYL